jgi:NTE family protein
MLTAMAAGLMQTDADRRRAGPTAFVFAGGAALASIQVGTVRPLLRAGIRPDMITGTSSGALNAAMLAADPDRALPRLETLWSGVRRSQVLPMYPRRVVGALAGRTGSIASGEGMRRLIERHLPIRRIEQAAVPLHVVAADTATREKVVLDRGDAVSALVATTALPGVFPPVEIEGRVLVDGGLAEDPPLGTAVERGAKTVYVLPVGWPLGPAPLRDARARAIDALDWLCWRAAAAELARWAPECRLYVVASPSIQGLFPLSNRAARRLMADAERLATRWLENPRPWPVQAAAWPAEAAARA